MHFRRLTIEPSTLAILAIASVCLALAGCSLPATWVIDLPGSHTLTASPAAEIAAVAAVEKSTLTQTRTPFQPLAITPSRTSTPTRTATPTRTRTPMPTFTLTSTATRVPPTVTRTQTKSSGLPEKARVSGVVGHNQVYTLDCEARSAVDLAAFFGVKINEYEFLERLPKSDDPDEGFVGSFNGARGGLPPDSYGVYAGPIADLLGDYGLKARAREGLSLDQLKAEIAAGRPVMVWVIGDTWPGGAPQYYTAKSTGNKVRVANFEHTAIVIGYTKDTIELIDNAMDYTRLTSVFKSSWGVLGNMAVTVGR